METHSCSLHCLDDDGNAVLFSRLLFNVLLYHCFSRNQAICDVSNIFWIDNNIFPIYFYLSEKYFRNMGYRQKQRALQITVQIIGMQNMPKMILGAYGERQ